MTHSSVEKIIPSHPSSDGDGVKIRRVGLFNQPGADPFLMMDELLSDNPDDFIGGFPPHPHRGMETLTYLIHGSLEHQDHMGNKGLINSGGAQWMSAGRGVIHSEMPAREMKQLHGFQLWINLPAENKMQTPDYRDVSAEEIPQIAGDHWSAKLIAGDWDINGVTGTGPLDTSLLVLTRTWVSILNRVVKASPLLALPAGKVEIAALRRCYDNHVLRRNSQSSQMLLQLRSLRCHQLLLIALMGIQQQGLEFGRENIVPVFDVGSKRCVHHGFHLLHRAFQDLRGFGWVRRALVLGNPIYFSFDSINIKSSYFVYVCVAPVAKRAAVRAAAVGFYKTTRNL